jgi:predicted dithiol-disulfide oxidoreductase (DUF899 family)
MISNTTDLSDHEVVSHQEWLNASADFSGQVEGTRRRRMRGLSAFTLEDGIVHHTYSCHQRGVEEFNITISSWTAFPVAATRTIYRTPRLGSIAGTNAAPGSV